MRSLLLALVLAPTIAAQQLDSVRTGVSRPAPVVAAPDTLGPPISPRRAFLYSLLLPGAGQARLDRQMAGGMFFFVEIAAITLAHRSAEDLRIACSFAGDSMPLRYRINATTGLAQLDTNGDPIERMSSRPDFMMLLYPVITMRDPFVHRGSRTNLLGQTPDSSLVRLMSNETQVNRDTPPTLLIHSTDDKTVPVENSLMFYAALRAAAVPAEMHIFEYGGHGFGLAPADPVLGAWTTVAESWMRRHGWIGAP